MKHSRNDRGFHSQKKNRTNLHGNKEKDRRKLWLLIILLELTTLAGGGIYFFTHGNGKSDLHTDRTFEGQESPDTKYIPDNSRKKSGPSSHSSSSKHASLFDSILDGSFFSFLFGGRGEERDFTGTQQADGSGTQFSSTNAADENDTGNTSNTQPGNTIVNIDDLTPLSRNRQSDEAKKHGSRTDLQGRTDENDGKSLASTSTSRTDSKSHGNVGKEKLRQASAEKQKAIEELRAKRYGRALEHLENAESLHPGDDDVSYYKGRAYDGVNDFKKAEKSYKEAIQRNGNNALYYFYLGQLYFRQKKYNDSQKAFLKASQLDKKLTEAHFNRGVALERIGNIASAESEYRRSIKDKPAILGAFLNLSVLLKKRNRLDDALRVLTTGFKYHADDPELHYQRGEILSDQRHYGDAIKSYKAAIAKRDGFFEAWFNMALAYSNIKNNGEALLALQRASALHPDDPAPYYEIGRIHEREGKTSEASSAYEKALEVSPTHAGAATELAELYVTMKVSKDRADRLDRAVEAHPGDYRLSINAGRLYEDAELLEEARKMYKRAIKAKPQLPDPYMLLAAVYQKKGDFSQAAKVYEALLQRQPRSPGAHEQLGYIYVLKLNKKEEGIEHLRQYIRMAPDDPGVSRAKAMIQAHS